MKKSINDLFKGYSEYERNDRINKIYNVLNFYYSLRKTNVKVKVAVIQTTNKFHISYKTLYNYISVKNLVYQFFNN